MVKKERFFDYIKSEVQVILNQNSENYTVEILKNIKKNDQMVTGLVVRGMGNNISPCIYLDGLFENYLNGYSSDNIIKEIVALIENNENPNIDINEFINYENAKEHLTFRIVDAEENEKWLEDKVWEPMGDFAKVCYLNLENYDECYMSAAVTINQMEYMGVTKERMLTDAQLNLESKEYVFISMREMLLELMGENANTFLDTIPGDDVPPVYILTNTEKMQGAAMIARSDIMEEIGNKLGYNYYVLPSSVHEVLILPAKEDTDIKKLSNMVSEINMTEVSLQDKLSDKVQYFDREQGRLYSVNPEISAERISN